MLTGKEEGGKQRAYLEGCRKSSEVPALELPQKLFINKQRASRREMLTKTKRLPSPQPPSSKPFHFSNPFEYRRGRHCRERAGGQQGGRRASGGRALPCAEPSRAEPGARCCGAGQGRGRRAEGCSRPPLLPDPGPGSPGPGLPWS